MYQLSKTNTGILYLSDNAFIPFDPDNTDYAQFKKDILDGAELLDADGQVMPDAIQFVKELP
jgi:hypothetical protein